MLSRILGFVAAALAGLTGSHASAAARQVFDVPANGLVEVRLLDRWAKLRIDPDFLDARIVNASLAQSLNLRGSLIGGGVRFGKEELNAKSRGVPFAIESARAKKSRVHWFDRDVSASADGIISPGLLPFAQVRFRLREASAASVTRALPTARPGKWGFTGGFAKLDVDGGQARIGFALDREHSIASAGLGTYLMQHHGGSFLGPTVDLPIRYGVQRPMRRMHLKRPLMIASLAIQDVFVRVDSGMSVPEADAIEDSEEVIVVGKRKKPLPLTLSVGSGALINCSDLTFKNAEAKVELTCRRLAEVAAI